MTNPFATFRKNQKYWMAAIVLLAILAFVVAPAIDTASQAIRGGGPDKGVVVRWTGGQISAADLDNGMRKHSGLVRFLAALANEVLDQGGVPRVPGFNFDPQQRQILDLGIQTSGDPYSICRTRILASHGESLGIVFDDVAIDDYITQFCDNKVSNVRIEEILDESTGGLLNWFEIRELLKMELAAKVVTQTGLAAISVPKQASLLPVSTPGRAYRDFLRMNQTAKVEAFPVMVEDFMDQVIGNPTEAEIQAIYDAGMSIPSNPNSPNAGFLKRYHANVEYVEANLQAWINREKEKLTEEELKAEYDRRVELGQLKVPVTQETPESNETGDPGNGTPETQDPDSQDSENTTPENASSTDSDPASTPSEGGTGDGETAEDTNSTNESSDTSDTTPPASAETEGDPADDSSSSAPDQDDQAQRSTPPTRLVSFLQEETPPKPSVAPSDAQQNESGDATTDDQSDDASPTSGESAPVSPPANDAPTDDAPTLQLDTGANAASQTPPPVVQPPQLGQSSEDASAGPVMRTQTFEEARDTIADSLARDAAIPALDEALTGLLEDVMQKHYGKYRQYRAFKESGLEGEDGNPAEEPAKPDLKKLAEERGLIYHETGLVDQTAISQTPFGLSNLRPGDSGLNGTPTNVVMTPNVELFFPLQSSYFDQAALMAGEIPEFLQYLFWKTEERPAYIPELSDIREEVVEAWKRNQARQLAEDAAKALSAKVKSEGENVWDDALNTAERSLVIETDPFTWMTRFNEFMMTSNVPKLDAVGPAFMQEVFATPAGQPAVAPNMSRNVFYVFRVTELNPPESDLQQRFNADPLKSGPRNIAARETEALVQDWFLNLEEELGVEWMSNVGQFN